MRQVRIRHRDEIWLGDHQGSRIALWDGPDVLSGRPTGESVDADAVDLLAPCQPGKVLGVAENYPGVRNAPELPGEPLVFLKPSSSVVGPCDDIRLPADIALVWGESELAVVLCAPLRDADDEAASRAILGYTIANDVTAESPSGYDHHLARSKGADSFCPLGPWIDTSYRPDTQVISGFHNDELLRTGTLDQRLRGTLELLTWLSRWTTLDAGDVVLTGAPARTRDRLYLQPGDTFRCEIAGLGSLENSVCARD